jgi:hypothetical protein
MKNLILFILFSLIFSSCFYCHDCIGPGQNASSWLIYENNEMVIFKSQTNEIDTFYAKKGENPPDDEYCGQVGSASFHKCDGDGSAYLYRSLNDKSADFFFWIHYSYPGHDEVERESSISFLLNNMDFNCNNKGNNAKSWEDNIETLSLYSQNGTDYEHVFHCTVGKVDSTVTFTEFYYQKKAGLLKYIEKDGDSWTLQYP